MPILDPALYTIAWIAPLEIEARAALCLFDHVHDGSFPATRGFDYVLTAGTVCGHNVVLATLPPGQPYGTGSASALAGQMKLLLPNLWFGLLVGVAAGLPDLSKSPPRDIRLGDVLVALPEGESAGIVAYDLGKEVGESSIHLLQGGHVLARTETVVQSAIGNIKLKSPQDTELFLPYYRQIQDKTHADGTFADPGQDEDVFFELDEVVHRRERPVSLRTRVWYGPIGSGEKLMRDAATRNKLRNLHGIIGLEMEAAGTMNTIPVGVIRGVCDYADCHKNKQWQPYAAAMAAAYAKAVLAKISPKSRNSHFLVPLRRNQGFIGREALLNRLLQRIFPGKTPDSCQMTVLEGLGGVGKTQIALEAAYRLRNEAPDCSVFWVTAISTATFEKSYRDIGHILRLEGMDEDKEDVKALVQTALNQRAGNWLLIIDNADDPQLFFGQSGLVEYLPHSSTGSILFTTRNHLMTIDLEALPAGTITVAEMTRAEAIELLHRRLRQDQVSDAASTANLLDFLVDLPLAISQASAYMAKTGVSTTRYLQHCISRDKQVVELLSKDFNDRHRHKSTQNPVATTWLVSFQQILRDDPLAAQYLGFMSFLSEKGVPRSVLPPGNGEFEADEAIGRLVAYAFITKRAGDESYDMHRLVGLAMRNWIEVRGELQTQVLAVLQRLQQIVPYPRYENRAAWDVYIPHALRALNFQDLDSPLDVVGTSDLLSKIGGGLYLLGRYKEATDLHNVQFTLCLKVFGKHHPDTIHTMYMLATALHDQGELQQAETLHRQGLDLSMAVHGAQHVTTLGHIQGLAATLNNQSRFNEAESLRRQSLDLCRAMYGDRNGDTLHSMGSLALTIRAQGKLDEAESLHRLQLNLSTVALGMHHPATLDSMEGLAIALTERGKSSEAEALMRKVIDATIPVLGMRHPQTISSIANLGLALGAQSKDHEAEVIFRQVVDSFISVLGHRHHRTLFATYSLADSLRKQARYDEAEALHRQTLNLRTTTLGMHHLATLQSMGALGATLGDRGEYKEAENLHRQALDSAIRVLGPRSFHVARFIRDLALSLDRQAKYGEAEAIRRWALENGAERQALLGMQGPGEL